jgi:hypothetical protein
MIAPIVNERYAERALPKFHVIDFGMDDASTDTVGIIDMDGVASGAVFDRGVETRPIPRDARIDAQVSAAKAQSE